MKELVPVVGTGSLTAAQFQTVADVPPETEWLANTINEKTRRAYKIDVDECPRFLRLKKPEDLRTVTRAHVIARRKDLEARGVSSVTIWRKLSVVSWLFEYLCERNAVASPRSMTTVYKGSTP